MTEQKIPLIATMFSRENDSVSYLRLEEPRFGTMWYRPEAFGEEQFRWVLLDLLNSYGMERQFQERPAQGEMTLPLTEVDHMLLESIYNHLEQKESHHADSRGRTS